MLEKDTFKVLLKDLGGSFGPAHSDEDIEKAQEYLGCKLPESYKVFLKEFGYVEYLGKTIYGLTGNSDFKTAGFPNVVWLNKEALKEKNIPKELIVFFVKDEHFSFCFDTSELYLDRRIEAFEETPTECSIVILHNETNSIIDRFDDDFFSFLIHLLCSEDE